MPTPNMHRAADSESIPESESTVLAGFGVRAGVGKLLVHSDSGPELQVNPVGIGSDLPPPAISRANGRIEPREAAFESSLRDLPKAYLRF